ncbi:hypothetical protein ACJX0J_019469, partial [Zea mays]
RILEIYSNIYEMNNSDTKFRTGLLGSNSIFVIQELLEHMKQDKKKMIYDANSLYGIDRVVGDDGLGGNTSILAFFYCVPIVDVGNYDIALYLGIEVGGLFYAVLLEILMTICDLYLYDKDSHNILLYPLFL